MITLEKLKERKTTIESDIKKVEETLTQLESQRNSMQANLFALQGANQQIDFFITECDEETKEDKEKINHLLEVLKSEKILNKTREMTKYHLSESNKALNTLKGFPIYKTLLKINEYLLKRTY